MAGFCVDATYSAVGQRININLEIIFTCGSKIVMLKYYLWEHWGGHDEVP